MIAFKDNGGDSQGAGAGKGDPLARLERKIDKLAAEVRPAASVPRWVRVREAAQFFGVCRATLYRWGVRGMVPVRHMGKLAYYRVPGPGGDLNGA